MDRRFFNRAGFGLFAGIAALAGKAVADTPKPHRVVFQVSTDDRRTQEVTLGNAHNYAAYYKGKAEPFAIEVVAFGPGFSMMRGDTSMVKGAIASLQEALGPAIAFSACQNSRRAVAASEGKTIEQIPQLPGIKDTPAGVVRVAELQEQGWSYVRS